MYETGRGAVAPAGPRSGGFQVFQPTGQKGTGQAGAGCLQSVGLTVQSAHHLRRQAESNRRDGLPTAAIVRDAQTRRVGGRHAGGFARVQTAYAPHLGGARLAGHHRQCWRSAQAFSLGKRGSGVRKLSHQRPGSSEFVSLTHRADTPRTQFLTGRYTASTQLVQSSYHLFSWSLSREKPGCTWPGTEKQPGGPAPRGVAPEDLSQPAPASGAGSAPRRARGAIRCG